MPWKSQSSFTGGIISEKLFGRVDIPIYQNSVSDMINNKVQPHGGIARRSGTLFCWEVKDSSVAVRVIPFEATTDDTYVIEAGPGYFRFGKEGAQIEDGGSPVELSTPYAEDELFDLQFVQSSDVMWITHKNHRPQKLLRYSDIEWYLDPVAFIDGPYMPINGSSVTLSASAATGTVTLTAASAIAVTDVQSIVPGTSRVTTGTKHGLISGRVVTITGVLGATNANGTWSITVIDDYNFTIQADTSAQTYTSGGTVDGASVFVATDVGMLVRIWHEGDAKWAWGDITAYISPSSVTVEVNENNFPVTGTVKWKFGKFSETTGWPKCCMLYELRQSYAGSPAFVNNIDLSQTDLFAWFQIAADETLLASDAIGWSLFSQKLDDIVWLAPGRGGLAVGTSGGCWLMTGSGGQDDPMTGDGSINAKKHTAIAADGRVMPVSMDNAVLFVSKSGQSIHEFAFLWEEDSFRAPDLSILADHLTRETRISDMDVAGTEKILWCVLGNGELLGLTYMRAENVIAWHRHQTGGTFESVCCVSEGAYDVPYLVVKRNIDGADVKYIENIDVDFVGPDITQSYFLDSGMKDVASPADNIVTGLDHLEGESVYALVDGKVVVGLTVASGQVTLPYDGEIRHVGLNFFSDIETLPLEDINNPNGSSIGRVKDAGKMAIQVTESYGAKIGRDFVDMTEVKFNQELIQGVAVELFSGEKTIDKVEGQPATDIRICIRQDVPLPLTVNSIVVDMDVTED